MVRKIWTGIGSRDAPQDIARVVMQYAYLMTDLGYAFRSGGCPLGMDHWCQIRVYRHFSQDKSMHRIYLSWSGMAGLIHDPRLGLYDAQRFDNYEDAKALGLKARGSFEGLGRGGIAHHSRNPYQILGDDLNTPSDFVFTWAKPIGKQGRVKGGTATAVKIALDHGVPVYNLYYPEVLDRVQHLLLTLKHQRLAKMGLT